jgi:tetratricopeptide (TPR) repeat protein/class 3 adenylate cyclase
MSDSPTKPTHTLEIAHVLFTDIVGYSKLPMDQQEQLLMQLQEAVRQTSEFARAEAADELIRLPTGDGMALVFFRDAEAPVRCALELSRALRNQPNLKLRMGIHSGPVYRVADINANRNVAGGGINIAQRVMDCGDTRHILVSREVAEVLGQLSGWRPMLHDLGEVEVKHGVCIHIYNLYTDGAGNPELPKKISARGEALSLATSSAKKRKRSVEMVVVTTILIIASVFGWLFYTRKAHALTETDTVVLADFANYTGDAVFDDTLKQALATGLQQSPFINILSDRKVGEMLKLMGRSADERLDEKTALDLCQRTQSKAVLAGSIANLGSAYVVGLHALNCQTGDSLARAEGQASKKEDVLNALGKAATKLRGKMGESLSTIQKYDTPVEEATTPSLEALKAYSLALKTYQEKGFAAAIPFFKRAIELDPNFAVAYDGLGRAYSDLGETGLAAESFQKAYELRDRVSEREKFQISAEYYSYVTGELGKGNQTDELWAQTYQRDDLPRIQLGDNYSSLGQHEKAVDETLKALRLNPDNGVTYGNLMWGYALLNRLDEAKATYQQAMAHKLEDPYLNEMMYGVAFRQGDTAEMQWQAALTVDKPGAEDVLLSVQSDTEAFFGRLGKARDFSGRAVESARRADERETAALWQMNAALREAEFGNIAQARNETASALALASTRDVRIVAALALARAGDSARAQKMADELEKQNPVNTVIVGYWLPTIRSAIEINRNNPSKAIELLRAATSYELGIFTTQTELGAFLYPAYVRGQAYLLSRQVSEAAAEFQKFLNRGLVANCPLGALAHLGLARAYSLSGDTAEAKAAYQDFLTLWKDADPDIPILIAAKAEYAKLK